MPTHFRVIDTETTGLEPPPKNGIIEVGWSDLFVDDLFKVTGPYATLTNPGIPISLEAMATHHTQDRDLANEISPDLLFFDGSLLGDCDYIVAHNAQFDLQFIPTPTKPVICTYKVALRLVPDCPSHKNQVLRYYFKLFDLPQEKCEPAHRAGPDTYVTAHNLWELIKIMRSQGFEDHMIFETFVQWTKEPPAMPRCPIGKEKGKPWKDVDFGFLQWIIRTPTMDKNIVHNARQEIERRYKAQSNTTPLQS